MKLSITTYIHTAHKLYHSCIHSFDVSWNGCQIGPLGRFHFFYQRIIILHCFDQVRSAQLLCRGGWFRFPLDNRFRFRIVVIVTVIVIVIVGTRKGQVSTAVNGFLSTVVVVVVVGL